MIRKLGIITTLLLLVCTAGFAQQRAQFSQYFVNQYVLNPAAGGTDSYLEFNAGTRWQWLGYEAAPNTHYVSFHMPVGKESGSSFGHRKGSKDTWHAFGGYLAKDVTGPTSRFNGYISYAYNLPINRHLRVSLGLYGGLQEYKVDGNQFILTDEFDNVLNGMHSTIVPDAIAGIWLYNEQFFAGAAMHQLLRNTLTFSGSAISANGADLSQLNNHMFITTGMRVPIDRDWRIVPSLMVKYVKPAPVSVDINAKIQFREDYWVGASYRGLDSFILIAGMRYRQLTFSYSLDLTHSELRQWNYGSHELVIGFREPWPRHIDCPSKFW